MFGGLLVGLALRAAASTVTPERSAHSTHGSFLDDGDGRIAVRYTVEATRDGASFSLRRVVAEQDGRPLFTATASFQAPEVGLEYQAPGFATVPPPDDLPVGRYDNPWFESRDVPVDRVENASPHARFAWFRTRTKLPDDPSLHIQALVYLTDHGATRAVREPHAHHPHVERRMSVSLDHTVWLHTPVRVDEWLLSELHPVVTGGGRGLAIGSVQTVDGRLAATVAQEALLRIPDG